VVARYLLDVNVLVALGWRSHLHHGEALAWFRQNRSQGFATCPLTQLGFIRLSCNPKFTKDAVKPGEAVALLDRITALPEHVFWPDKLGCRDAFEGVGLIAGHQQLTDLYLRGLARANGGVLATFDGSVPSGGEFQALVEYIGGARTR